MNRTERVCVWGSAAYLLLGVAIVVTHVGCADDGDSIMGVRGSGGVDENGRRIWTPADVEEVEVLQQSLSNPAPIPISGGYLCTGDTSTYNGEQNWFTEWNAGDHCWGYNVDAFCRFASWLTFDGAVVNIGLDRTVVSIPNLNRYNMNDRIRSGRAELNTNPWTDLGSAPPVGSGTPVTYTVFADANNSGHSFTSPTGGFAGVEFPDEVHTFLGIVTSRNRWISSIRYVINKRCQ